MSTAYIDIFPTQKSHLKKLKAYNVSNAQTGGVHVPVTAKWGYAHRIEKKTHKTSFLPSGNRTAALLYNNDTAALFPPTRGNRHTGLLTDYTKTPVQYPSTIKLKYLPKLAGL